MVKFPGEAPLAPSEQESALSQGQGEGGPRTVCLWDPCLLPQLPQPRDPAHWGGGGRVGENAKPRVSGLSVLYVLTQVASSVTLGRQTTSF